MGPLPVPDLRRNRSRAARTSWWPRRPQSIVHDSVDDARPQIAWSFEGKAGDVVAPDIWPTVSRSKPNGLRPVLVLLGPLQNGRRPVLARGQPRDDDARHQAIDGFTL